MKEWKGLSVSNWFAELLQSDHFHVTGNYKVRKGAQDGKTYPSSLCVVFFLNRSKENDY